MSVSTPAGLSRRDWRVRTVADAAIKKLRLGGEDDGRYASSAERFLAHPADGVEEDEDDERGWGR